MNELLYCVLLLLTYCIIHVFGLDQSDAKSIIHLGYFTGSQKRYGDFFYNKPGQSISGAITLAAKVDSLHAMMCGMSVVTDAESLLRKACKIVVDARKLFNEYLGGYHHSSCFVTKS